MTDREAKLAAEVVLWKRRHDRLAGTLSQVALQFPERAAEFLESAPRYDGEVPARRWIEIIRSFVDGPPKSKDPNIALLRRCVIKLCHDALNDVPLDDSTARLKAARELVDVQAEDDGLWFLPQHITEAALQTALRELHEIIEGKTPTECVADVLERARERQP